MKRYRHVTMTLRRQVTEYASVPVAIPEDWTDEQALAVLRKEAETLEDVARLTRTDWQADDWSTVEGYSVEDPDRCPEFAFETPLVLRPYDPAYQAPPESAWIDVDGERWAASPYLLVREGSCVTPRGWCDWFGRDPSRMASPSDIVEIIEGSRAAVHPLRLSGQDHYRGVDELVFVTPAVAVRVDRRYLPESLDGLTLYARDEIGPVRVVRGDQLEMIVMPRCHP